MSELSKTEKKIQLAVDAFKLFKSQMYENQSSKQCEFDQVLKLKDIIAVINDINETLMRLVMKVEEVDPITGTKRFGPKSVLRINKMVEVLTEQKLLAEQIMPLAIEVNQYFVQPKISAAESKILKLDFVTKESVPIMPINNEKDNDDKETIKELAQKANELREIARAKRLHKLEKIERLKQSFQAKVCALNCTGAGADAVSKALSAMFEHSISSQSAADCFKIAISAITAIMDNILAHPDDISLRKLRLNHPNFQTRLGQFPAAVNCLIAVGFVASIQWKDSKPIDDEDSVHNLQLEVRTEEDLGEVLLTMTEPNPEGAGGTTAWIEWFDGLSVFRDMIASYM